ncbi:pectinesterase inhibitor 2-like, partial [Trifolium medium]|nr:pectinesterase inhibitor 2-like [Trifolium medium]
MIRFSLFTVVFLLCVVSSYAIKVVDVDTICKNVNDNPPFCLNLLKSKNGTDLVTLAQYTITVARIDLTNTVNVINKLISQSGSDLKAKDHYEYCLSLFGAGGGGALCLLGDGEQYLKNGDYDSFNVQVNSIIADYSDCINGGTPGIPPYHDKSVLPKYAEVVHDVVDI